METMEKPRIDWLSHVYDKIEVVPLETAHYGERVSKVGIILDPSGLHHEAGIVSKGYNLVPNIEAKDAALQILYDANLTLNQEAIVSFNGSVYRERHIVNEIQSEVQVGDAVALALDVVNSYDGSTRFSIQLNLCRLVCTNGMTVSHLLGGFSFKHNGGNDLNAHLLEQKAISQKLRELDITPLMENFRTMANRPMKNSEIISMNQTVGLGSDSLGRAMLGLDNADNPSMWDVYNAYTSIMSGLTPSVVNKNRTLTDSFMRAIQ